MQSIAAIFFGSFTLCSMAATAAIDCSSYVPTFGLLSILEIFSGFYNYILMILKDKKNKRLKFSMKFIILVPFYSKKKELKWRKMLSNWASFLASFFISSKDSMSINSVVVQFIV